MNENALLTRLATRADRAMGATPKHGIVLGIGDDAAIYRARRGPSEDLLFTTDLMMEGVHFRPGDPARRIGHRALARGLSDIAAMGGEPRFCLVSLAIAGRPERFLDEFYSGLLALARWAGIALAGGDLAHASQTCCDVVVCGAVPTGQALRRDGARPGDTIYVSGALGRGAAQRYRNLPYPPLPFGQRLRGSASACMDVSDGLSTDLARLCQASGVSARLDTIPVAPGATQRQALHGGEDYELLFTAPAEYVIPSAIAIGQVEAGQPGTVIFEGQPLPPLGYDHFRKP